MSGGGNSSGSGDSSQMPFPMEDDSTSTGSHATTTNTTTTNTTTNTTNTTQRHQQQASVGATPRPPPHVDPDGSPTPSPPAAPPRVDTLERGEGGAGRGQRRRRRRDGRQGRRRRRRRRGDQLAEHVAAEPPSRLPRRNLARGSTPAGRLRLAPETSAVVAPRPSPAPPPSAGSTAAATPPRSRSSRFRFPCRGAKGRARQRRASLNSMDSSAEYVLVEGDKSDDKSGLASMESSPGGSLPSGGGGLTQMAAGLDQEALVEPRRRVWDRSRRAGTTTTTTTATRRRRRSPGRRLTPHELLARRPRPGRLARVVSARPILPSLAPRRAGIIRDAHPGSAPVTPESPVVQGLQRAIGGRFGAGGAPVPVAVAVGEGGGGGVGARPHGAGGGGGGARGEAVRHIGVEVLVLLADLRDGPCRPLVLGTCSENLTSISSLVSLTACIFSTASRIREVAEAANAPAAAPRTP